MRKTGDLKLIQELNQHIILDVIRKYGPISRSEIAKKTKLSPTTVASAVSEMIEEGIVIDAEAGQSSGGRPPILVRFVPDSKFLIGVSITNSTVAIASMNLEAEVKKKHVYSIDFYNERDFIGYILKIIEEYISKIQDLSKCIGISIITPGIVDSERGIIRHNSRLKLFNIPLKDIVEERFGLKTWLDNDANAIALAEKQFGFYRNSKNLIYIQLGEGLGSGIVVNNTIFRGNQGGAGEFGHISIDTEGTRCECGNIGCLENYVRWPVIYSRILSFIESGKKSVMLEMAGGNKKNISQQVFLSALEAGDELAKMIAEETASYLASGLVTLVNLFNPEAILIGWEALYYDSSLIFKIRNKVKEHAFQLFTNELEIQSTTLGKEFQLMGAAAVLLQDIFDFSL
jgi:predicted NBD/HSP70 family sugar kinase